MKALRIALGVALAFLAVNAFGGGCYGLLGAPGVPVQWLEGSPFSDYAVPSAVLFFAVGGSAALAATAVFARWRRARALAVAAGAIVVVWLAVEVWIIGFVSWLQPATAAAAALILTLALFIPSSRAAAPSRPRLTAT
jgi:peptidoglycan/LPS O-acetylase OafA/YrhL